jgi:hypothetical protein
VSEFAEFIGAWNASEQALFTCIHNATACGAWPQLIRDKESNVIGLQLCAFIDVQKLVKSSSLIFPFSEEAFSFSLNYLESQVAAAIAFLNTDLAATLPPYDTTQRDIATINTEPLHPCRSM